MTDTWPGRNLSPAQHARVRMSIVEARLSLLGARRDGEPPDVTRRRVELVELYAALEAEAVEQLELPDHDDGVAPGAEFPDLNAGAP